MVPECLEVTLVSEAFILTCDLFVFDVAGRIAVGHLELGQAVVELRSGGEGPVVAVNHADERSVPDGGVEGVGHEAELRAHDEAFGRRVLLRQVGVGPGAVADRHAGLAARALGGSRGHVVARRAVVARDYEAGRGRRDFLGVALVVGGDERRLVEQRVRHILVERHNVAVPGRRTPHLVDAAVRVGAV